MNITEMDQTAKALVAPRKGILAADESTPTIKKRLASISIESSKQTRVSYRELLFTTAGLGEYISGVILFDETMRQISNQGKRLPDILIDKGIIPGIKVDMGAKPLAGFAKEKVTEGLDGLRERLQEYRTMGARFAKWRAVIAIEDGLPTGACMEANAHALARYAALCQEANLVPIVEPEVLMDGGHTIQRCAAVTAEMLAILYAQLHRYRVHLSATLLKPNMIMPGNTCPRQVSASEIARATVGCFRSNVPAAVPGIVFLSGGQTPVQATENLNALNVLFKQEVPWELSFSYGRALQEPVLQTWMGDAANRGAAQQALYHRAKLNGAARDGSYQPVMELEAEAEDLKS